MANTVAYWLVGQRVSPNAIASLPSPPTPSDTSTTATGELRAFNSISFRLVVMILASWALQVTNNKNTCEYILPSPHRLEYTLAQKIQQT